MPITIGWFIQSMASRASIFQPMLRIRMSPRIQGELWAITGRLGVDRVERGALDLAAEAMSGVPT